MADRFELSYVYARVCGSLSGAFLGKKAVELARSGRTAEVWRALFNDAAPMLPEAQVVEAAERRAVAESLSDFRELAEKLRSDEPFFDALRRKSEYARIKRILLAAREGGTLPASDDPSLEPGFVESAFPDLGKMFASGRYSWIDEKALEDLAGTENRLDRQYYSELWREGRRVPRGKAGPVLDLIAEEAELQNVVWALRLRRYYGLGKERIDGMLVRLDGVDVTTEALRPLDFKFDQREDWSRWAWESLVAASSREGPFSLDVRGVEIMARRKVYRSVRRALHMHPFTYTPLYCCFKIKEYETAAVIGIIEGVHLGAPFEEMASFAAGITGGSA